METPRQEGRLAHAAHKGRGQNPYLAKALEWDKGWRDRQVEQLTADGKGDQAKRIRGFVRWLSEPT